MQELIYIATTIAQFCVSMQNPHHCTNYMALCLPREAQVYPNHQIDGWLENCIERYEESGDYPWASEGKPLSFTGD